MTREDILSIITAIKEGDLTYIIAFLAKDANCLLTTLLEDANGREIPAIHYAVLCGQLEIVNHFLEKKPTLLNITDNYGQTPLLYAAANGHTDIVNYFISKNADLNLAIDRPGHKSNKMTPLDQAMEGGHYGAANALILGITAHQSINAILPLIKNGAQALELMVSNPNLTNILLQDQRVTNLVNMIPCHITEKSITWYKPKGRRPSWFAEIDREQQTSSVYTARKKLGIGSNGCVRLFQNREGEKIGVKSLKNRIIVTSPQTRDHLRNNLQREAELNKAAYPDTILSETFEFDYHRKGQTSYTNRYVMPYVEGQTAWVLMHETICPHQLAAMTLGIALELDRIHRLGIIHGDLNPENVMLRPGDNNAFLTRFVDFGCSYFLTDDSALLWTFHIDSTWIAPELCTESQLTVKPNTNQDVYGLGFSLNYSLEDNPCYQELLELYPSINTFISTSQRKTPFLRPDLQSFCEQLQNELQLQLKFSANISQTDSRPKIKDILKNHPLWTKRLDDSNSTAVTHDQKSNRIE
jgi:serine/threonine protein kinase